MCNIVTHGEHVCLALVGDGLHVVLVRVARAEQRPGPGGHGGQAAAAQHRALHLRRVVEPLHLDPAHREIRYSDMQIQERKIDNMQFHVPAAN